MEGCLSTGLFSDILFKLEDGTLPAHKPLLMARSEKIFCFFRKKIFLLSENNLDAT